MMRGQERGAILITLLCKSLCGFNGFSFTAGVNSAVLRTDNISLSLRAHTYSIQSILDRHTVSVCLSAGFTSVHP